MVTTLRQRFDAKWMPEPFSGCHLWTASVEALGYGRINVNGKACKASRVSWELNRGPIPDGLCVLHRCDTPLCCNPNHLFLGDKSDNVQDAISKGRWPSKTGENNVRAKITAQVVRVIRASAKSAAELARQFSISKPTISSIRSRRTWKHI